MQGLGADQSAGGYRGDEPPAAACQHSAEKRFAPGKDQLPAGKGDAGATHDLTAARIWGIIRTLAACGLVVLADKGYLGEACIRTPCRGRNKPASCKDANRAHARLRAPGERANAQLKSWRILRKLRCCPWRAGKLAKAIHVLQIREA